MRKELYSAIKSKLQSIGVNAAGEYYRIPDGADALCDSAIKHIDLWNRNVEFMDQEDAWPRPAVFVEFEPIQWYQLVTGVEYRAEARVRLHIVTDWAEQEDNYGTLLDLTDKIHSAIGGLDGEGFKALDLEESVTNHDHEDIVESIEVYSYVAIKSRQPLPEEAD